MTPPSCYRNAELAEDRFGELARRYAAALDEEDTLGAQAVAAASDDGGALLERVIAGGAAAVPDAPEPVLALLAELEQPPFAVDHELIDTGAGAITRHGFAYAAATRQSLFWGYSNGAAVKPLSWTGEMRTARAAMGRLLVTGEWLQAVIRPGGLRPRAPGWLASAQVRMIHARVRARLHRSGRWDPAAWGAPLNAGDSAFTLLEFTTMPLGLLRGLGFSYTSREVEGIYALWRLVGHLVGVPADLNEGDEHTAARLLALRELTAAGPDEGSRELVRALLESNLHPGGTAVQRAVGRGLEAIDRAVALRNMPAGYGERYGMAPTRASALLPVARAGFRAAEAARTRIPGADAWLVARNDALIERGEGELRRRVGISRRTGHAG